MTSRKTIFRRLLLSLLSSAITAALVACGSSKPITIAWTTSPPASMMGGTTVPIAATVANDSANKGVSWSCAPSGSCGSFSSATSPSGGVITYTAPATPPTGGNVTITAAANAKPSVTVSATVAITPEITVALSTTPTSMYVNDYISVTATVTNDSTNKGVTWSCTPVNACGAFAPAASASGVAVTYTAPAAVPSSKVVITATSVANTAASGSSLPITIKPSTGYTVTWTTPPPASLPTGETASIIATTTDPAGINFSCTPVNSCGTFAPTNPVASGVTVTYTAPLSPATVTITATSVTDNAISASATVTVTSLVAATLPAGNYVFSLAGTESGGNNYNYVGAFTVDSSGVITGGEQDFSDYSYSVTAEAIVSGTITATLDGNLLITITPTSKETYINGGKPVILDATLVSTSKALLTEFDSFASGAGELDLQATSLPAPTGGYAFFTGGVQYITGIPPMTMGGVIKVDSAGGISGTGSVVDINEGGNLYPVLALTTSTVTGPDNYGFVTFDLNLQSCPTTPAPLCTVTTGAATIVLDGYMVDATHIQLIENYNADDIGAIVSGTAFAQTGAGTFSSSSVSGKTYVVGGAGTDSNGPFQVAGLLAFASGGGVGGNLSFNDITAQTAQGGVAISGGTYAVDSTGDVTVTGVTDAKGDFTYNLQLYLTGDSAGHVLVISMDSTDVLGGKGMQQASGTTFTAASLSGSYALQVGQVVSGAEQDGGGAFYANGVSALTGFLDLNGILTFKSLATDVPISATFAATSTNGVLTVTGSGTRGTKDTVYLIDSTKGVVIEDDTIQLTLGHFELQQ